MNFDEVTLGVVDFLTKQSGDFIRINLFNLKRKTRSVSGDAFEVASSSVG